MKLSLFVSDVAQGCNHVVGVFRTNSAGIEGYGTVNSTQDMRMYSWDDETENLWMTRGLLQLELR